MARWYDEALDGADEETRGAMLRAIKDLFAAVEAKRSADGI
jgi:hypothetical protein